MPEASSGSASASPLLETRALSRRFGGLVVSREISLALVPGERRVVLGPNGAGKTTLFNLLAGSLAPSGGDIFFDGASIARRSIAERARLGIARSYQKNNLFESLTVRENLALAVTTARGRTASLFGCAHDGTAVREAVEEVAERVALHEHLELHVARASYGARRQLEVGLALATAPRLLLMDEPTSGVGPAMIEGFHALIHSLPKALTVLIIEHDMDLAFDVADRITVLNHGEVVFEGTPAETRASAAVREIYLGSEDDA